MDGARQLSPGLAASRSLRVLDLTSCKLRAEGVQHLAIALASNSSLEILGLDKNSIGDRGVKFLVEALERNTCLRELSLATNSIGLVGCRLLSTVLKDKNSTLCRLFMAGNDDVEDSVLQALEDLAALQRRMLRASRQQALSFPSTTLNNRTAVNRGGSVSTTAHAREIDTIKQAVSSTSHSYRHPETSSTTYPDSAAAHQPGLSSKHDRGGQEIGKPGNHGGGGLTSVTSTIPSGFEFRLERSIHHGPVEASGSKASTKTRAATSEDSAVLALRSNADGANSNNDELEDLLNRYRTIPALDTVPSDSLARPLINFGYTGM
ncbi:hypothetical protein CEUSTIGMA_g1995.t1 [Chlamydomonas eustigma]|uniref:Uncharacterized protein n=1 Tax=Chlamydomonas eustigma TaxID=1157962 RepID=A0A250WUS1_9CHLO|nr:hypothetical protein CEUSTIGMA_g1995.t1 [Chlamydomonas eustigma]|eukprot:GAX74545.1 hypothetical protein CEUSTIGMA_g1995.t1 [Chlamydomonas eustigma]